jgi:hypothetical protein
VADEPKQAPRNKRQKFVQLVEARIKRVVRELRLIGNLSNRSAYEYSSEDVKKIFKAIGEASDAARNRFSGSTPLKDTEFKLEDE